MLVQTQNTDLPLRPIPLSLDAASASALSDTSKPEKSSRFLLTAIVALETPQQVHSKLLTTKIGKLDNPPNPYERGAFPFSLIF